MPEGAGPILDPGVHRKRGNATSGRGSPGPGTRHAGPAHAARLDPSSSQAGVETLPRVGAALRGRLAKLGLRTIGDLLAHRPRRYERPIDERSIRDLFGDEEAVIEGVVLGTTSRRGGAAG